jgi:hypothetical protein
VALVRADVLEERIIYVSPKRQFLQESHGVASQKMAFFIKAAMKIRNLTFWANRLQIVLPQITGSFLEAAFSSEP